MKTLKEILENKFSQNQILEKLVINKDSKLKQQVYNYHPQTRDELKELVNKLIKERGWNADLNDIDTSEINDMSNIFEYSAFNGDISKWNVSNVKNMNDMFFNSKFTGENGDISNWDVSNVEIMYCMFYDSKFNGDISNWDVSKVDDMQSMFEYSGFNGDISNWDVSKVKDMRNMFKGSSLEKNPPKWYKKIRYEKLKRNNIRETCY